MVPVQIGTLDKLWGDSVFQDVYKGVLLEPDLTGEERIEWERKLKYAASDPSWPKVEAALLLGLSEDRTHKAVSTCIHILSMHKLLEFDVGLKSSFSVMQGRLLFDTKPACPKGAYITWPITIKLLQRLCLRVAADGVFSCVGDKTVKEAVSPLSPGQSSVGCKICSRAARSRGFDGRLFGGMSAPESCAGSSVMHNACQRLLHNYMAL